MSDEPIYYTTVRRLSAEALNRKLAGPPQQASKWVYAAAAGGSPAAQVTLGQMLLDGHGMARDPQAAFRWFQIAARSGDPDAINMRGRCLENGWGVAIDRGEARKHFEIAAARSHPWAQFNLGMMLLHDSGHPGDVATALSLFVRAARQGNEKAMNMLGRYRELGWVGRIDIASAIRWYRRAATRDCFRAAAHLGRLMLSQDRGAEAIKWYGHSIDKAPVHLCRELAGQLLENENPELRSIARHALRRAAEGDEPQDLVAYGHELALGRGGAVDFEEAAVWLARAESKGFPGALALLSEIVEGRRVG